MWPVLVEFLSASSEGSWRKKEEQIEDKIAVQPPNSAENYVGRLNKGYYLKATRFALCSLLRWGNAENSYVDLGPRPICAVMKSEKLHESFLFYDSVHHRADEYIQKLQWRRRRILLPLPLHFHQAHCCRPQCASKYQPGSRSRQTTGMSRNLQYNDKQVIML